MERRSSVAVMMVMLVLVLVPVLVGVTAGVASGASETMFVACTTVVVRRGVGVVVLVERKGERDLALLRPQLSFQRLAIPRRFQ